MLFYTKTIILETNSKKKKFTDKLFSIIKNMTLFRILTDWDFKVSCL
ncbi:hypothetical protein M153_7650004095 [Pseudoloma neurophilia]|uniref:Uncharacterized protein n=1 Tax=Pseudoloma neurophilia TaxID=146866 RepID=A0A0R0LW21_9MICR|nr:hypothetical protein M153_7650004095 [Pseudoloma neurophilia]